MLGDDLAQAIPELQAHAESAMRTPCRISRPGTVTSDPATGADVLTRGPLVYDGSSASPGCKIQTRIGLTRDVESVDSTVTVQGLEVHVPTRSGPYRDGDVVEILQSARSATVVRTFRVDGLQLKTWQTAQRLPVTDIPGVGR